MFPRLASGEIDRLRRSGQIRRYAAGAPVLVTGDVAPGMYVLIKESRRLYLRGCTLRLDQASGRGDR